MSGSGGCWDTIDGLETQSETLSIYTETIDFSVISTFQRYCLTNLESFAELKHVITDSFKDPNIFDEICLSFASDEIICIT